MWKRREGKIFLAVHLCLLSLFLLFPLYVAFANRFFSFRFGCFFHDYLSLYCPFCGGTRAISSLLRFQILDAIRYNVLVVGLAIWALVLDVLVLVRLLKNKEKLLRFPRWGWIVMVVILVIFMILRNALMIFWGIDPTGDLGAAWKNFKM